MSYNDPNHIISSNIGNDEFKYYYENDSGNLTYEDIDTCRVANKNSRSFKRERNSRVNYK
jgi:hypothetical protein